MDFPSELQSLINEYVKHESVNKLKHAYENISHKYRDKKHHAQYVSTSSEWQAYLLARMPATYAAVCQVLSKIVQLAPEINFKSLLDIGAGPATATWAAIASFATIQKITLLEQDSTISEIGKNFMLQSSFFNNISYNWQLGDLNSLENYLPTDLLILSYCIGEQQPDKIESLIENCWQISQKAIVIIEPGTIDGFKRIELIRQKLIYLGANLLAPCPHMQTCPLAMAAKNGSDWCHFFARVARSKMHQKVKNCEMGYEDEKFSYIIATKEKYPLPTARLLRYPIIRTGHQILTLCTENGVSQQTVTKKDKHFYKMVKKLSWGDSLP